MTSISETKDVTAAMATMPKKKKEMIFPATPKVLKIIGIDWKSKAMPLTCNVCPVSAW